MSLWDILPIEVRHAIFEFDATYHDIWRNQVIPAVQHLWREFRIDCGYSIRNYREMHNNQRLRYYSSDDRQMHGIHVRF
jgi:hypothetical protein